ncbi:hypothetical protein HDE_01977 [Halotydeus destructor]|nr:hypothetical protein HDE_01977 [Halotydeus destructor]
MTEVIQATNEEDKKQQETVVSGDQNENDKSAQLDQLTTTLLMTIKQEFGDKVKDKRLARSLAKVSKCEQVILEYLGKSCEIGLNRNIDNELNAVKADMETVEQSEARNMKVIESSAMIVQKISLISRLSKLKDRTDPVIQKLSSQESQLDELTTSYESLNKDLSEMSKQMKLISANFTETLK